MKDRCDEIFASDDRRWEALVGRDQRADGAFFYGVRTTGVYCRPGCFSRLPRRENVMFFESFEEAQRAGYRPCKRCSPNAASGREHHIKMLVQACKLIEESDEPPALEDLAGAVSMSRSRLHQLFKEIVGVTPKEYAATVRMRRLKRGLEEGISVTQAIFDAGFNSSSRFYEKTTEILGMTASEYKKGAAGVRLRVAVVDTSLGWLLVAATDQGICSLEFGDAPDGLLKQLRVRFPNAEVHEYDVAFEEWLSQVTAFIETPVHGLDLPLDIQGTAFQRRVWKALQEIPPGSTRSYAEIARQIGKPRSARAVGRACASNRIAVVIPCHRVIRGDGHPGGYRWGMERKRALLEREKRKSSDP